MVTVAGHWEIGYMAPIVEQYYWSFVLRDFGIGYWLMNPVSGIQNTENRRVSLNEFSNYQTMLDSCDELQRVFLEPKTKRQNANTIWLHELVHPENCVYVFGSAHYNPTLNHVRKKDLVVSIKTVHDNGILWSNQCLSIVLYDRLVKSWQLQ